MFSWPTLIKIFTPFGLLLLANWANADDGSETGESLYLSNCAVCHRAQGEGIKDISPPLAGNAYVLGDPQLLVQTVLDGRGGMPSFRGGLSDEALSQILSYVRAKLAPNASAINREFIQQIREGGSDKIESDHDV